MERDGDSKNELVEGLKKAARGNSRSKTARLREIFDEIEAAKESGLSLKTIVAVLADRGLVFDLATFVNIRHRIKNERRDGKRQTAQKPHAHIEAISSEKGKLKNSGANITNEIAVKPVVANSGEKKEILAPELSELVVRPDLSLEDEVYEQFRKKD